MKNNIFAGILLISGVICAGAHADEPCAGSGSGDQADDGKCLTTFGKMPSLVFDFPDDDKKKADDDDKKPESAPETDKKNNAGNDKGTETEKRAVPETCTYTAYAWDTKNKRAARRFTVSKPYSEVTDDERDPNAPSCTICEEDQVGIDPSELGISANKIRICHAYAPRVRAALAEIRACGEFDIEKLEGYRPGRTRGKIDAEGLRTEWSSHSFGTALDINAHRNAMYSDCPKPLTDDGSEVASCRRVIGGDWDPGRYPRLSIVRDGAVYRAMTKFWKWGGEIEGATKDVMHFSVTGY